MVQQGSIVTYGPQQSPVLNLVTYGPQQSVTYGPQQSPVLNNAMRFNALFASAFELQQSH